MRIVILAAKLPARILIVEDTVEFAELVRLALGRLGAEVNHVTLAEDALRTVARFQPDLILLDIGLPDMDGWRLLDTLRKNTYRGGEAPVIIVLTSHGDPANRLMGKLQGVDGYLIKTCTMAAIRSTVAAALRLDFDAINL